MRPEGSNCAVSNSGTLALPKAMHIPLAWLLLSGLSLALPHTSIHAATPCFHRTHVASVGSRGTPNLPSEDLYVPSPLRGAATPRQDPRPLEGPQGFSRIPERSGASSPLDRTPNPHVGPTGRLNPERDTRPSARPRVPQSSQSPQRDPSPLGVSLDPLREPPALQARPPMWLAAGSPCRRRERGRPT